LLIGRDDLIRRLEKAVTVHRGRQSGDRKTTGAGRVGLVLDGAIALTAPELADFGFRRGPKSDACRGDYYALQP
jgi:hypothetical protein